MPQLKKAKNDLLITANNRIRIRLDCRVLFLYNARAHKEFIMKKHMIVMLGGPGVGKGTFSKMLCELHDFKYIETGALLRALPPESRIAKIIAKGDLVPEKDVFDILEKQLVGNRDIILDGFPRTLSQAKWLVKNYADKYDMHVVYLDIPETLMVKRINKRIREGGDRKDDTNLQAVHHRLDIFQKKTAPAIEWLRDVPNIKFYDVKIKDAPPEKNFVKVLAALKKRKE